MLGLIMFGMVLVTYSGYGIFCIATKSTHQMLKHALQFGLAMVFGILIRLFGHGWSFQWKNLFVVFMLLLFISGIQILVSRKYREKNFSFRKRHVIFGSIGHVLLLFIGLLPAIIFPPYEYPAVTGTYQVGYETHTYRDDIRKEMYGDTEGFREVNVAFWYPKDTRGTYPLLVFSHGFSGVKSSNVSTFMDLASHGYVVCSIDHPYQSFYTQNENQNIILIDKGYIEEYKELATLEKEDKLVIFQKWMEIRIGDINLAIDTIINENDGIYQLVDKTKIGVFGHSLGGAAAMGLPRVRADIDAVVNIDAPMLYEFNGVEDNWYTIKEEPYPTPILHVYSEYLYQNGILTNDEEYFENRLVSATAPASYEVVFTGTQHMSLTDLTLFSPFLANLLDGGRKANADKYECIETMNSIMVQFFDAYLKEKHTFTGAGIY